MNLERDRLLIVGNIGPKQGSCGGGFSWVPSYDYI